MPDVLPIGLNDKMPILIQSISTDGLQVKVRTIALQNYSIPRHVRAAGADELEERGYSSKSL